MTQNLNPDVIVVGAGLVGLATAISFAKQNKEVVLIGANNPVIEKHQAWDARIYALTPGTETWLKTLDVWQHVDSSRVNPIHAMHLWDERGEKLVLRDDDANLQKLGVIIENQNLMHTLWEQVNALSVTVITDGNCAFLENTQQHITLILENGTKISAKLLVAADGVNSWVRAQAKISVKQKEFNQTAIVANFLAEKNHQNIARQWFAPHETLALLPLVGKNVSLVWSVLTERADTLLKLSGADLAEQVAERSKHELGALKQVEKALSFSLNQQTANALIAARVVLVGDAAHQIHPMAGQGVNLGFRDVMQLTALATKLHAMQDIGDNGFLRQYERSRKADIAAMNTLTSGLDYLFASDSGMMMKVRSWGLQQLNHQTTIKKLLMHQASA